MVAMSQEVAAVSAGGHATVNREGNPSRKKAKRSRNRRFFWSSFLWPTRG